MILNILDFSTGEINILTIPNSLDSNSEIEDYITETLGYNVDEISYMVSDNINLKISTTIKK